MRRRSTVGGWLDYATLAATVRRPAHAEIAANVGRFHADGHTTREIAQALGLSVSQVIAILAAIAAPSEPTP